MAAIPLLVRTSGLLALTDETPSLNGPCISSMMVPITLVDLASGHGTLSSCDRARPTATTADTARREFSLLVIVVIGLVSSIPVDVFECSESTASTTVATVGGLLSTTTIVVSSPSSDVASVVDVEPAASSAKYSSLPITCCCCVVVVVVGGAVTVVLACSCSDWTDSSWRIGSDGGGCVDDKRSVADVIVDEVVETSVVVVFDKTGVAGSELASMDVDDGVWDVESGAEDSGCWVIDDVVSGVGKTEDMAAWWLTLVPRISAARFVRLHCFPLPVAAAAAATAGAVRRAAERTVAEFAPACSPLPSRVAGVITGWNAAPFHGSIPSFAGPSNDSGHLLPVEPSTANGRDPLAETSSKESGTKTTIVH